VDASQLKYTRTRLPMTVSFLDITDLQMYPLISESIKNGNRK
jgi:hypothetical protein